MFLSQNSIYHYIFLKKLKNTINSILFIDKLLNYKKN